MPVAGVAAGVAQIGAGGADEVGVRPLRIADLDGHYGLDGRAERRAVGVVGARRVMS
jgi:hypothetical protein